MLVSFVFYTLSLLHATQTDSLLADMEAAAAAAAAAKAAGGGAASYVEGKHATLDNICKKKYITKTRNKLTIPIAGTANFGKKFKLTEIYACDVLD